MALANPENAHLHGCTITCHASLIRCTCSPRSSGSSWDQMKLWRNAFYCASLIRPTGDLWIEPELTVPHQILHSLTLTNTILASSAATLLRKHRIYASPESYYLGRPDLVSCSPLAHTAIAIRWETSCGDPSIPRLKFTRTS